MKSRVLLTIGLSLVVIALALAGCNADLPTGGVQPRIEGGNIILSQQNTGIWVTGEGKVSVVPDVAILSLGVEAQAKKVSEANQQAAKAMAAVITELDRHGVAEKDIKTQHYTIQPVRRWENNREILIGYRVSNIVAAKIRNVEDTGVIIDAVAEAGGDYTRVNSIGFTVDDPTDYYEEVREKAMDDAEAKAKQLADLAGISLGKPTYINEGSVYIPAPRDFYLREAGAAAPDTTTPISAGETEIRLSVQVVFSIN